MKKLLYTLGTLLLVVSLSSCEDKKKEQRDDVAREVVQELKNRGEQIKEKDTALVAANTRGKKVYRENCTVCHQGDGGGVPNLNPPLAGADYTLGDKDQLITLILNGSSDKRIEVNGKTYANVMPAFKSLEDGQIADVLTYIRNNFGNEASIVTTEEVSAVRSDKK